MLKIVICNRLYSVAVVIFTHHIFIVLVGNTRVITQSALQTFQDEMKKVKNDPYKVVMRQTKLPISLLNEKAKVRSILCFWTITYKNRYFQMPDMK